MQIKNAPLPYGKGTIKYRGTTLIPVLLQTLCHI